MCIDLLRYTGPMAYDRINVRAIIQREHELFVVKHKQEHSHYCLPGGGVEKGEALDHALMREIHEELAVVPSIGPLLFVHQFITPTSKRHILEFFFRIENGDMFDTHGGAIASHAHELVEAKRVSVEGNDVILPLFLQEKYPYTSSFTEYVVA